VSKPASWTMREHNDTRYTEPKIPEWAITATENLEAEVERLRDTLRLILPMARGYAAEHPVGDNQGKANHALAVLYSEPARAEGGD
jgi:hypothetical protein